MNWKQLLRHIHLDHFIQGEVSQKEKNKYHILVHIYGIEKNNTVNWFT